MEPDPAPKKSTFWFIVKLKEYWLHESSCCSFQRNWGNLHIFWRYELHIDGRDDWDERRDLEHRVHRLEGRPTQGWCCQAGEARLCQGLVCFHYYLLPFFSCPNTNGRNPFKKSLSLCTLLKEEGGVNPCVQNYEADFLTYWGHNWPWKAWKSYANLSIKRRS